MSLNRRLHHGWMVLFKFGARAHLEQFRKNGFLYMKSSTYFSELERRPLCPAIADPVRADRFEGTYWIFHPKTHDITFEWPNIKFTVPPP